MIFKIKLMLQKKMPKGNKLGKKIKKIKLQIDNNTRIFLVMWIIQIQQNNPQFLQLFQI